VGESEQPPERDPDEDSSRSDKSGFGKGLASGYLLAGALVVGLLIGLGIDQAFGTDPLWTLICSIAFLLAGLYQVVKDALK